MIKHFSPPPTLHSAAVRAAVPKPGLTKEAFSELGNSLGFPMAVPPSQLPEGTQVPGLFPCIQGRTLVTGRCIYVNKEQRRWWLAQLPERAHPDELLQQFQAPMPAATKLVAASVVPLPAPVAAVSVASSASQEAVGYDRVALDALLAAIQADSRRKIDELASHPLFVSACRVEWARLGKVAPIVRALWGEDGYSGPKHTLVKGVVETFKDHQTMLAQMLAA